MYFWSENMSAKEHRQKQIKLSASSSHVILKVVSFAVALFLAVVFVIDCGDWILNQERNVSQVNGTTMVHEQSRIITILAFLRFVYAESLY